MRIFLSVRLAWRREARMPADSLQKQDQGPDGRLFQKGRSGSTAGRRMGCRNRVTLAAEALPGGRGRGPGADPKGDRACLRATLGVRAFLRLCFEEFRRANRRLS